MTFSLTEKQLAYANYRLVFSGANSGVKKRRKIKELLVAHHTSIGQHLSDREVDRLSMLIQGLATKNVFTSTARAMEIFRPNVPRIEAREASEASVGRQESELLNNVDSTNESDDNREGGPQVAVIEEVDDKNDEPTVEDRSTEHDTAGVLQMGPAEKDLTLFPLYLPFETQHLVLGQFQHIIEQCCFAFVSKWLPAENQKRGWETSNAVELTQWTKLLPAWQQKLSSEAITIEPGESLREVCLQVAQLRHAAVHRLPLTANTLQSLLQAAVKLTTILKDEERSMALTKISEHLGKGVEELKREKTLIENSFDREMETIRCRRQKLDEAELELFKSASQRDCHSKAEVGMEICVGTRQILADLKPAVGTSEIDAHSVNIEADTRSYWLVMFQTIRARIW